MSMLSELEENTTALRQHVHDCDQRYDRLISRFDVIDNRLDKLERLIFEIKDLLRN